MATAPSPPPLTFPPTEAEPAGLYEVIGGRVVEKPPPGVFEVDVAIRLVVALEVFARPRRLGRSHSEMLFLIDRGRNLRRRPDVSFVSGSRWPLDRATPRTEAWDVVPDLAVEVVSPTNTADVVLARLEEYFGAGVRLVWVIFTGQGKVYAYESPTSVRILQDGDDLDGGEVLPGFRHPVGEVFGGGGQPSAGG